MAAQESSSPKGPEGHYEEVSAVEENDGWKVAKGRKGRHKTTRTMYSLSVELTRESSEKSQGSSTAGDGTPDKEELEKQEIVSFFSGNPSFEVTSGVIHLYRYKHTEDSEGKPALQLCVLAVPSYMSGADFCQFAAGYIDHVTEMRVLRDASPNKYMVLITFSDAEFVDLFYEQFNGKPYNSLDPEICHVLYVADIEVLDAPLQGRPMRSFSAVTTELPTCPVCLERLDSALTGLVTILCNHTFHCHCLSRWGDSSCPVCRYCQQPSSSSSCHHCGATDSLWMCLLCGHIGCGRYDGAHAHAHHSETGHQFSMELETQRVWDYLGDGYVHRLIQSKADGKLVELPAHELDVAGGGESPEPKGIDQVEFNSKLEAISMEYNYLLTSQLETQRAYYEKKLSDIAAVAADRAGEGDAAMLALANEVTRLHARCEQAEAARKSEEHKVSQARAKLKKQEEEMGFLKEVNSSLLANQKAFEEMRSKMEAAGSKASADQSQRVAELEEQVRDLMFYLEAQEKIQKMGAGVQEDIKDGQVVLAPETGHQTHPGRGGRRRPAGKR